MPVLGLFHRFAERLLKCGARFNDNEETKIQKRLAVELQLIYLLFQTIYLPYIFMLSKESSQVAYFGYRLFFAVSVVASLGSVAFYCKHGVYIPLYASLSTYCLALPFVTLLSECDFSKFETSGLAWPFSGVILLLILGSRRQAIAGMGFVALTPIIIFILDDLSHRGCSESMGFFESLKQLVGILLPMLVSFAMLLRTHAVLHIHQQSSVLKSELNKKLIRNILPESVSEQLQQQLISQPTTAKFHICQQHSNVTVCFTDIVGFTALCLQTDAQMLVATLCDCFSMFDMACVEGRVEKIKTIGDAYMMVGFPVDEGELSQRRLAAESVVEVALKMLRIVSTLRLGGERMNIRIGIHSGSAVSGVIGCTKFCYDLWGPTVNLASRMESGAIPNVVHVTEETKNLIAERYSCTHRGTLVFKGVGATECYIVNESLSGIQVSEVISSLSPRNGNGLDDIAKISRLLESCRQSLLTYSTQEGQQENRHSEELDVADVSESEANTPSAPRKSFWKRLVQNIQQALGFGPRLPDIYPTQTVAFVRDRLESVRPDLVLLSRQSSTQVTHGGQNAIYPNQQNFEASHCSRSSTEERPANPLVAPHCNASTTPHPTGSSSTFAPNHPQATGQSRHQKSDSGDMLFGPDRSNDNLLNQRNPAAPTANTTLTVTASLNHEVAQPFSFPEQLVPIMPPPRLSPPRTKQAKSLESSVSVSPPKLRPLYNSVSSTSSHILGTVGSKLAKLSTDSVEGPLNEETLTPVCPDRPTMINFEDHPQILGPRSSGVTLFPSSDPRRATTTTLRSFPSDFLRLDSVVDRLNSLHNMATSSSSNMASDSLLGSMPRLSSPLPPAPGTGRETELVGDQRLFQRSDSPMTTLSYNKAPSEKSLGDPDEGSLAQCGKVKSCPSIVFRKYL